MNVYEDENVVVKESEIEGFGLFAKRDFEIGEVILHWNPKKLTDSDIEKLTEDEKKRYMNTLEDGTKVLMGIPERYVNHSDTPNTKPEGQTDIATRDIQAGEEITSSYEFES